MKRFSARALLALLALAGASAAFAQASKIGVMNADQVLQTSIAGKKALAQLTERDKTLRAQLDKLDQEIQQLQSRLQTQGPTLSAQAAADIQAQAAAKQTNRTRLAEDAQKEMQELQYRLYSKIQADLFPIIEALGKEKGLDVILDLAKSGTAFFQPAIDVTAEVVKRYDAAQSAAPAAKPAK